MLLEVCELMGICTEQAIAVGDGANDLPMMMAAGLSIAYHPKPAVREKAMISIRPAAWTARWNSCAEGGAALSAAEPTGASACRAQARRRRAL